MRQSKNSYITQRHCYQFYIVKKLKHLRFIAYYPMNMLIYDFLSSFCRTICCTTKVNEQEVLRAVCVYVCVFVSQVDVDVLISCYQFRIWIQFDDWPQILIMKISILNPCTKEADAIWVKFGPRKWLCEKFAFYRKNSHK